MFSTFSCQIENSKSFDISQHTSSDEIQHTIESLLGKLSLDIENIHESASFPFLISKLLNYASSSFLASRLITNFLVSDSKLFESPSFSDLFFTELNRIFLQ